MYKENLALNNPQWLICHKTKPNHIFPRSEIELELFTSPNDNRYAKTSSG